MGPKKKKDESCGGAHVDVNRTAGKEGFSGSGRELRDEEGNMIKLHYIHGWNWEGINF